MRNLLDRMRPVFEGEGAGSGAASSGGEGPASASAGGSTALTAEPVIEKPAGMADHMYPAGSDEGKAAEETVKTDDQGKAGEWAEYVNDDTKTAEENAALKAEHDKKKPAADEGKKEGEKKEGDDKPKLTAEEIDLTPPEGFQVDSEIADQFKQFVIDGGFTKEQVETLKGMQVKLYEKQTEAHAKTVAAWGESLKTDKEFGGEELPQNLAHARAAIRAFFPGEAKKVFDTTGLGNHPDIVRGFVRMGKAMSEAGTFSGKNGEGTPTIVDAMYGSS